MPDDNCFPTVPTVARVYNFGLDGKDNFAADRAAAEEILRVSPGARDAARDNRRFLGLAARWAAGLPVDQFIDIGSGLPDRTGANTHEYTRPGRMAYVDIDPVAVAHAEARLTEPDGSVIAVQGDLRDPAGILTAVRDHIDLERPVAVILGMVLHFLGDEDACRSAGFLKDAMAPGSVLIMTHGTADAATQEELQTAQRVYAGMGSPLTLRGRDQVTAFLDGFTLPFGPAADVNDWWPRLARPGKLISYGAIGVKPGRDPVDAREDPAGDGPVQRF
jgi:O-methyltransferase involved in polyketide biosynthesis